MESRGKIAILVVAMWGIVASGQVVYVDSGVGGGEDGSSWGDAYRYLQDALASASSGDEVRVAQGVYRPDDGVGIIAGDREASFSLMNGVAVRGGYAGLGQADPNARDIGSYVTVLSGDLGEDDEFAHNEDNSFHVVTSGGTDATAVLEGFTIAGGNAFTSTGTDGTSPNDHGGGLYNVGGGPTVAECVFSGNWAFHGGGMYNDGNASAIVSNCTFRGNSTTGVDNCQGGAVYCGGESDVRFERCRFIENAGNDGGGIFTSGSSVELVDCLFSTNTADGQGSAVSCWENSHLTATGCSFVLNVGGGSAASVNYSDCTITNCTFISNQGRGIMESFCHSMIVANCTFAGNDSTYGGAVRTTSANVTVANCILWGNGSGEIYQQSPIEVRYSCIEGWSGGGVGNIVTDPEFSRDPAVGDLGNLHLRSGSPCIDAGDSDAVPSGVVGDYDGNGRFYDDPCTVDTGLAGAAGAVVDMGAYEYCRESPFWKEGIVFPGEAFEARGSSAGDPGWVKFAIVKSEPNTVYFQDSEQYVFHYNFATERLAPFLGMTAQEFSEVSLYEENQQVILGTVITAPMNEFGYPAFDEYGIQFIRQDPYPKEEILALFELVRGKILCRGDVGAFYFPAYEQLAAAESDEAWFELQGIAVSSTERWASGNACYSAGWALGELKYFDGNDIETAYLVGALEPNDILLTDGVPAEIPFVAGVITLSPSTPNSHVAILARTFGVPFVHLAVAEDAEEALELVGRMVFLYASEDDVQLLDIEGSLTAEEIDEVLALKAPGELSISATETYGSYSASTDGLGPEDVKYFGGKAANYGILRTAIPDNCPVAAAISFDLWNAFLAQRLASHKTLREEINVRLAGYSYPPSSMTQLGIDLDDIRDMFKDTDATSFTKQQENAIIDILEDGQYGFDADRKIRFRSSTNVEDSNQFTGAGLYDSYSGCLADDLDGDEYGPSICDSTETNERGVFRAIRKVFASFYNDNAFLERLRYGVSEADVGMAILVHHSFPDEIELANGVATLEKGESGSTWVIELVTQAGSVSVANPEDGSIPEEVSVVSTSASSIEAELVRSSNLVVLGDTVMDWQGDYDELSRLLVLAAEEFETVTGKTDFVLDFEYKKVAPDGSLVVKQIREIPQVGTDTAFLINKPTEYCVYQGQMEGYGGEVFAYHRLKSRWRIETKPIFLLKTDNLNEQSFYADVRLEYANAGRIRSITGQPALWPFASHSYGADETSDSWRLHHLANRRLYELQTSGVVTDAQDRDSPLFTIEDYGYLALRSDYNEPVRTRLGQTSTDEVQLCPCAEPIRGRPYHHGLLQSRYCASGGVTLRTTFCWPDDYEDYPDQTAPLLNWVETVIEGIASEPVVLRGDYSQTYCPKYGNDVEYFLFEPRLEPGISQSVLDELRASDIRLIYMANSYTIETYGFDDESYLAADTDDDNDVDLPDYARFAQRWLDTVCDDCGGADFTGDGRVDRNDLWELADQWLGGSN